MSGSSPQAETLLRDFRGEVLRWNKQVSLVSRKEPAKIFDRLMAQCRMGLDVLLAANPEGLVEAPRREYYDLGSGGGLPGIVWHVLLSERGLMTDTTLVEPREKRAWFLERLRGLSGMPGFEVSENRWGGESLKPDPDAGTVTLISMKALKLTDPEILAGIPDPENRSGLVIARYYPPGEPFSPALASELEIPKPGLVTGGDESGVEAHWVPTRSENLFGVDFSLLISCYKAGSS